MAEVHVIGELVGANGFPDRGLFCRWKVSSGQGWKLLEGTASGQTHVDRPYEGQGMTVFNHPIDLHFGTRTIQGWPKLSLQIWHHDEYGRNELYAYGFCNIPTTPGMHELKVATWRPAGTLREEVVAFFLGGLPQLKSEELVHQPNDRYRLQTVAMGHVYVNLAIITKDFEKHGVHTFL